MKRIVICLLGPFGVTIDDAAITTFGYAKVRALLAYLAVERARPHPRAELATLLWPDQSERTARASLSQALTTLRNALDDKSPDAPLIMADTQTVQLNPAYPVEIDVDRFLEYIRATQNHEHYSVRTCPNCSEHLKHALELYRGDFLGELPIPDSDVFEEWSSLQREYVRQRVLSALEGVVQRLQWCGDYSGALEYVQRLVALEPLLETHQRTYLRLLALNGETTAALAQYRRFETMLSDELGIRPENETTGLIDLIRRGSSVDFEWTPVPFHVPMPATPIVNRNAELVALSAHLRNPKIRAVTIVGTGGVGKTRIALEVAHTLRYDFEDGVHFVELAPLSDAALVADAIAQALGVKERPRQNMGTTLREYLRAKHILLVLDNFEHLVSAAALVSELLAGCPALTVLVTSRVALNIRAEQQYLLDPLDDQTALQLFLERARPGSRIEDIDEADRAIYAAICRRLDRLPLALELIAVWAGSLAPRELLQQIERPLQTLVSGPRDMPARHQALRSAIQWSYELLDAETQQAFAILGIFAGSWSIDAAQALFGESLAAGPVLARLHQASLLQRQVLAGKTRFVMLETIREFALERLSIQANSEQAYARYVKYYASFALTVNIELLHSDAPLWQAHANAEQDNVRQAFRRAIKDQAYTAALQIASGVWRFYHMSGLIREAFDRLETALVYREHAPLELQCFALRAAGTLAGSLGDFARGRRLLEEGANLARSVGDIANLQGMLTNLGYMLNRQGELELAVGYLEEALAVARQLNNRTSLKFPLGLLGTVHQRLGNFAQATVLIEECLRINQECQDPEGTANILLAQAALVLRRGRPLHAQQLVEEALDIHTSLNHQLGMGSDYALMGDISYTLGNPARALAYYHRCLTLWRERLNGVDSALVFDGIARLLVQNDDPRRATLLIAAGKAIRMHTEAKLAPAERERRNETRRLCRMVLGEATFLALWRKGLALSVAEAIDLALKATIATEPGTGRSHHIDATQPDSLQVPILSGAFHNPARPIPAQRQPSDSDLEIVVLPRVQLTGRSIALALASPAPHRA